MASQADKSTFDILLTSLLAEQLPGMNPIAESIAPLNPVSGMTGTFRKRIRPDLEPNNVDPRRPAGKDAERVESTGYEVGTFNVVDYMLEGSIPIESSSTELSENENLQSLLTEAEDTANRIIFAHEKDVHKIAWEDAVPDTKLSFIPTVKWDAAGATIKENIDEARVIFFKANGFFPQYIVIPNEVFIKIKNQQNDMFESIKFTTGGNVVEEIIASLTGIPNVLVPMQLRDSQATTAINGKDLLWNGDKVRLFGVDNRSGLLRTSSFLKTVQLNSSDFPWFGVNREFTRGNKSTVVSVSAYWDIIQPNKWAVTEIKNVLT